MNNKDGRFSFLGCEPFQFIQGDKINPFPALRKIFRDYRISAPDMNVPFFAGAVGYFAYDLGFVLEKKIALNKRAAGSIPQVYFNFYNTIIAIDHIKNEFHILSVGFPGRNYRMQKKIATENFKNAYKMIRRAKDERVDDCLGMKPKRTDFRSDFTKNKYIAAVVKAKDYIKKGDIYQVNLSQRLSSKSRASAVNIYMNLRRLSPSNFSAYFDTGDFQIISSSPERFLNLSGGRVVTKPMKGTRARSLNSVKDIKLRNELIRSPKDKAELLMIVDLERNDLGRVCDYGSVKVDTLREIEKYNSVFQATSTISAKLHPGKDRFDLLQACFPGGSITGCPKIRAMEIIDELEPLERSIYTGCLGYLSFCGNMDFNIMIRTILKQKDKVYLGVGGGIVADSEPVKEYEETLVKAKAMIEAIAYAG
jgi:para-aminobenzoate synthetase component 1